LNFCYMRDIKIRNRPSFTVTFVVWKAKRAYNIAYASFLDRTKNDGSVIQKWLKPTRTITANDTTSLLD
jgi:hypothetical protein